MLNHLQVALDFVSQLEFGSPEYVTAGKLIDLLIETNTFTYADQYEYQRYIRETDAQRNARKGATQ